ncbi:hypothetical protein [Kitasatospora sp. GP82]|uniref:hypothetical protein n=1 Tax=Kitasatospora sp. GP82 TaxID=3035089 RepID=UPI00247678F2|nr:hypothetical protein [Kitasatospora sp. GP82]MDH6123874.1 hypothetical protein [Kitasatospora sp. GP82]
MDVTPQLLQQDRADFERALAQALAADRIREAVARSADGPGIEDLRTLARAAAAEIAATAAEEYGEYARLRAAADLAGTLGGRPQGGHGTRHGGGGLMGALAVFAPVLTGTAAVVLCLLGCILRLADSERRLADSVVEAAWTAAIVAAASAFAGVGGLLVTAARQRSAALAENPAPESTPDSLLLAREAWRVALLERGVAPFLLSCLEPSGSGDSPA